MKPASLAIGALIVAGGIIMSVSAAAETAAVKWKHLSTVNGDLAVPNAGDQQTASIVLDIDKDGDNDFVISERTQAPSVIWYRRGPNGWTKYVVDNQPLHIEAGGDFCDIDADGDLDIVLGGDWQNNKIWWWENPQSKLTRRFSGQSKMRSH